MLVWCMYLFAALSGGVGLGLAPIRLPGHKAAAAIKVVHCFIFSLLRFGSLRHEADVTKWFERPEGDGFAQGWLFVREMEAIVNRDQVLAVAAEPAEGGGDGSVLPKMRIGLRGDVVTGESNHPTAGKGKKNDHCKESFHSKAERLIGKPPFAKGTQRFRQQDGRGECGAEHFIAADARVAA